MFSSFREIHKSRLRAEKGICCLNSRTGTKEYGPVAQACRGSDCGIDDPAVVVLPHQEI